MTNTLTIRTARMIDTKQLYRTGFPTSQILLSSHERVGLKTDEHIPEFLPYLQRDEPLGHVCLELH